MSEPVAPPPEVPVYGTPPQPERRVTPPGQPRMPLPPRPTELSRSDERLWSALGHLGGILFPVLPALAVYLGFRDRSGFVGQHGREALNFQISVLVAYVVVGIVLPPLTPLVWLANVVFCIAAAVAANRDESYRYPYALRLVR